jgi:hypothetical protein
MFFHILMVKNSNFIAENGNKFYEMWENCEWKKCFYIKMYFIIAAGTAPTQKPFFFKPEKTKTNRALPVIIKGIIGAKARGRSPVYIEIRLGIKHNRKADSNPKVDAEINKSQKPVEKIRVQFTNDKGEVQTGRMTKEKYEEAKKLGKKYELVK